MLMKVALVLSSLAALAAAETHSVTVGGTDAAGTVQLVFDPIFVNAVAGDIVEFTFKQKNHSVIQTSFANVCHPLLDTTTHEPVFETEFYPVATDATEFPTYQYTVTDDTRPLWFYCSQKLHCGKGMVFSINCPATGTNSLAAFQEAAAAFGVHEAEQAAASSSWAATATPDTYGGQTYDPVWHPTVTETVTLGEDVWTTTYESYANSPDPTPDAAEGNTYTVEVGANGALSYNPPVLAAAPRDKIIFKFLSKNHTVTQSSFGNPCRKLEFTSTTGQVGFDSGFIPGDAASPPTYEITVNDTAPIWVYCRQTGHCGQGMVFSINADETSDRNSGAFVALAQTINGTGAASPSSTGEVSYNAAFASASAFGGVATIILIGLGSVAAMVL